MAHGQGHPLRDALGALVTDGGTSESVRPEIASSWARSIASHLQPHRLEVPYEPEGGEHDRLRSAAQPVVERLTDDLAAASMSLVLTDKQGRVIDRSVSDRRLTPRLDAIMLAPGFLYGEDRIGTNAIGTALAEGECSIVTGDEHFADALTAMACAAAPIVDPAHGSVIGAIDLTCAVQDAHPLMSVLVKHAARDVEQRLVSNNPHADRLVLESFVRARRYTRGPLAGLSERAMYTNARAAKLLDGHDRALLWELVCSVLVGRAEAVVELPIPAAPSATCQAIVDDGTVVGALVRFEASRPRTEHGAGVETGSARPRFGWSSLSENELGVADLVADGLSNREAAARLFMSRHTVDFHLRQTYQKLGIHSRVELARLVIERRAGEGLTAT